MNLHVIKDPEALSTAVAEWIIELIERNLRSKKVFSWLLSGGNTPKHLYSLLATEKYRNRIAWDKIQFFFGDERVVPFDDERNNGRMAYETLLSHVPVPRDQIHFISTDESPELSVNEYEKILHLYFRKRTETFDLSLLGMGEDGHVLSLFPGSRLIHENNKAVASVFVPEQSMYRVTLTAKMVNQSACTAFLVTGVSKSFVLKKVLEGSFTPEKYPSQIIKPVNGELHWFVDEAAGSMLSR